MTEQLTLDLPDLAPATVRQDPRCWHITLTTNPPSQCDGAFVDLGPVLHWWAYTPVHLDPAGARELAAYLTAWADRPSHQTRAERAGVVS